MGFKYENFNKEEKIDNKEEFPLLEFKDGLMFDNLEQEIGEEYLSRVMKNIVDYSFGFKNFNNDSLRIFKKMYYGKYADKSIFNFFSFSRNSKKIKDKLLKLDIYNDQKFSKEKNKKTFKKLELSIRGANREVPKNDNIEKIMDFYDNTNQRRDFFSSKRGKDAHSYISIMFGVPEAFANTEEGKDYIHKKIDNKTIFLFGGGDSIRDLLKSEEFKPKKVINFDPFIKEESIDKNPSGIYESQMISVSDNKIREMADKNEIPKADEVWATYSVPFYLDSSLEIKELITNMISVLNEGGNARISPIAVQSGEKNGENFETRKKALIDSVKSLIDNSDYNISVFNDTLKIHKINKLKN